MVGTLEPKVLLMCANHESQLPNLGRAVINLGALITLGLMISWWVLYYSDYFPILGGLLGLGGLFAWIAFLSNLVSDARKNQLQDTFDRRFMQKGWPTFVLLTLFAIFFLALPAWHGTIIIDSVGDNVQRTATVSRLQSDGLPDQTPTAVGSIPPHERTKFLVPTSLFGSRDYQVKLSGLPALRTTVYVLSRVRITPPTQFLQRPVPLVRLANGIAGTVSQGDFKLQIVLDGKEICQIDKYHGQAVWIAADEDVDVPEHLLQVWRLNLPAGVNGEIVNRWLPPLAPVPNLVLPPNALLTINVLRYEDNGIYAFGFATIPKNSSIRLFPIEVDLDVPHEVGDNVNRSAPSGGVERPCPGSG